MAARQDYDSFYSREIDLRQLSGSPPVKDLFTITVSGQEEAAVYNGCGKIRSALSGYLADLEDINVLGPAPASITKVNNRYRYRILLSCTATRRVRNTVAHVVRTFFKDKEHRGLHAYADADPYDI